MIPEELLVRLLVVALERLPDHRVVLDQDAWEAMRVKHGTAGGGLLLEQGNGGYLVRLADHEDRVVMADRVRAAGGLLVESPDLLFGIVPDSD